MFECVEHFDEHENVEIVLVCGCACRLHASLHHSSEENVFKRHITYKHPRRHLFIEKLQPRLAMILGICAVSCQKILSF